MMRRLRIFLPVLLLAVSASGCEGGGEGGKHPTSPSPLLGLGSPSGYTLANDPLIPALLNTPLKISGLVGLGGGTLEILGHRLEVPVGAVLEPTLFTVAVLPTGSVEVYLTATRTDLLRRLLNVGGSGFRKPVRVTLSYSRSTNVPDPSALVILRMRGPGGVPQPMPSQVDPVRRTVTADLDHFSPYSIAFPN